MDSIKQQRQPLVREVRKAGDRWDKGQFMSICFWSFLTCLRA